MPTTAVCTSTLEMGIDIGSVTSIAQVGAPRTVSSLRQRLGRSGRRGEAATLRIYITEQQITARTPPADALRSQLVQSVAIVNHYGFHAAFRTAPEDRLIASGRTLGTLPVDYPLMPGSLLIFGGRRWSVVARNWRRPGTRMSGQTCGDAPRDGALVICAARLADGYLTSRGTCSPRPRAGS